MDLTNLKEAENLKSVLVAELAQIRDASEECRNTVDELEAVSTSIRFTDLDGQRIDASDVYQALSLLAATRAIAVTVETEV
ncbi:hypothetical protein VPHD260_0057 [Vibrio phage D260]